MSRKPFVQPTAPQGRTNGSSASAPTGATSNYRTLRDYGATTSTAPFHASGLAPLPAAGGASQLPGVEFAGFSPTEFMSLSESIVQNVDAIRSSLRVLEQSARKIGTHSDSARFRDKLQREQKSTNQRIEITTGDLNRLNDVVRHGDKQQKLNVNRMMSDFQTIVDSYLKCLNDIASRQRINVLPTIHDEQQTTGQAPTSADSERQQLLLQQHRVEVSLQREVGQRIEQIEDNVQHINSIMGRLNIMVNEQRPNVDLIDSNVNDGAAFVEEGRQQLEQATRNNNKYRKKVLLLLVLAVILGLVLTGILVSSLKT